MAYLPTVGAWAGTVQRQTIAHSLPNFGPDFVTGADASGGTRPSPDRPRWMGSPEAEDELVSKLRHFRVTLVQTQMQYTLAMKSYLLPCIMTCLRNRLIRITQLLDLVKITLRWFSIDFLGVNGIEASRPIVANIAHYREQQWMQFSVDQAMSDDENDY